jgi:hypothetical protein
MGPMKGLGIIGSNPGKQVCTHCGVGSTSWSGFLGGTRDGDTWAFRSEEVMGGDTSCSGFNVTMASPDIMTFTWEAPGDGSGWTVMMGWTRTKKEGCVEAPCTANSALVRKKERRAAGRTARRWMRRRKARFPRRLLGRALAEHPGV